MCKLTCTFTVGNYCDLIALSSTKYWKQKQNIQEKSDWCVDSKPRSPLLTSSLPSRNTSTLHPSASLLPMMLMLMSPAASQHPCPPQPHRHFPTLRPSAWPQRRGVSRSTAAASRACWFGFLLFLNGYLVFPPPLPPVSPPPLPHAAYWRTAPIWRSITPSATAEAQNPPPSRRMLHVWTRWGKGCCRLTKQVDVYRK